LKVELRAVSDREALLAMDIENRHRADISPYERGLSYARWLRSGHFASQEEIARALRVSASQISRLLKLARLPSIVVAAFASPLDIREGWGPELMEAWDDPARRAQLLKTARAISAKSPRPAAHEIHQQLISQVARAQRVRVMPHDEVVKDASGKPLLRVCRQTKCVNLSIPSARLSIAKLADIKRAVAQILQRESP
jgi:ParB family chromosome partitioning protein